MRDQTYILPKSYRKIAFGFFVASFLVAAFVFYLAWAKVTIIVIPNTQNVAQEFIFSVKEQSGLSALTDQTLVAGKVRMIKVDGSQNFEATGVKAVTSEVLGEVTIVNNYSQPQTLIRTTRLVAPDQPNQVLLRLNNTVTVPAGSQLRAQVYPENKDEFSGLKPTKLIIPGLWGPLQDKIYAEVTNELKPGGYQVTVVTQEDLQRSESQLKDSLFQKVLTEVNSQLAAEESLWPKLVSAKVNQVSFDVAEGAEVAEFQATMNLEAVVVVFDESQVISLARNKLKAALPAGKQLVNLDPKSFSYNVENYDVATGEASVKASLIGSSVISGVTDLVDQSELGGMTEQEVQSYFSQFSEIKSVEVKFQPAWLKKIPRLQDKVQIEVATTP